MNTINGRTPEEIKKGLECCSTHNYLCGKGCPYKVVCHDYVHHNDVIRDALAYIQQLERERDEVLQKNQQLERERDAAVRTARWQFEKRSDGSATELPVCSGCGATPKYYVPMNDVGMQVPPFCHECGSRMAPVVKMEVER